ncbi:MAG: arginine deiminase [Bacteroidales bacterium]|nr:arginine deiminase [Bacteroidales bacterium]
MSNHVNITSETGRLETVIIHTPGREVENMTPESAKRALYSDILNLDVAIKEYEQFKGVLNKVAKTYEVKDLLQNILFDESVKSGLLDEIYKEEKLGEQHRFLYSLNTEELTRQLLEGVLVHKNNLTNFLSKERYSLPPLHNFFFTRDAAMAIHDRVLIGEMANKVRNRESLIMKAIFRNHPDVKSETIAPLECMTCMDDVTIEGGDVLVASENILLIGIGARTTTQGVDYILSRMKERKVSRHIVIQELPDMPESFIHLDMTFTFLDNNQCMVYEPLILKPNKYQTVRISIEDGEVTQIRNEINIIDCLRKLGMDMNPILCGGKNDQWIQEREQWHSGANFFAFAPGKVIGYERNVYTMEAMNKNGYEIIRAKDVINGKIDPFDYNKCVVTIGGSELARGGGGARCMTMPVRRKSID